MRVILHAGLLLFCGLSASGAESFRLTDGFPELESAAPLEGYFLSPTSFKKYTDPPDQLLKSARRMDAAELAAYSRGGEMKVSADYPLLIFKNQGSNLIFWKGKPDGQQQVFQRVWNGKIWDCNGYTNGHGEANAFAIALPADLDRCYVVIEQQSAERGHETIHTESISLGACPPFQDLVTRAIEANDLVVYRPHESRPHEFEESPGAFLDCVKGNITRSELMKIPGLGDTHYMSLLFLSSGERPALRFWFSCESNAFHGPFGNLYAPGQKPWDARDLRWKIARGQSGAAATQPSALRALVVHPAQNEWQILEYTLGTDAPISAFRHSVMRHQRDGGDPIFEFVFNAGQREQVVKPEGRFGVDSFNRNDPERGELAIEYHFIQSHPSVIKLSVRPTQGPWKGTVFARFHRRETVDENPAIGALKTYNSATVNLNWEK